MGSLAGYELERAILGGSAVYPGHPVTLALMIMHAFPDLQSAMKPTEHGWPEALGSDLVPGGGGAVYQALDLLKTIKNGHETAEEAVKRVKADWLCRMPKDIEKATIPGHEQAEAVTQKFLKKAESWLTIQANSTQIT